MNIEDMALPKLDKIKNEVSFRSSIRLKYQI